MKKEDLIKISSEGLSMEEIPTISNLEELKEIINTANLDNAVKIKMTKKINHLIKDTINHANIFINLIKNYKK